MNTAPFANTPAPLGETGAEMNKSRLSALADGELTDLELQALLLDQVDSSEMHATWACYQVIGDALKGSGGVAAAWRAPQDFLAGVREGLHGAPGKSVSALPAVPLSNATMQVGAQAKPAANDPVFRWKMVAGLASLAAVMAVSWTVLGTSQGTLGGSAQLALAETVPAQQSGAPSVVVARESRNASQPVVVNTNQGPLIRDARLEALMAEHRHGGVSALQMPAGFLRNATYDDAGR
jgi:sigma-E factor negative regulatory protein RseA